ncbi:hypothetical protein [Caulobacter segnis]|uniref:Uncharacterized protein n=1 Tax=Caulobacter segnis TaxID=88688 RepID=A0A2W5VDP4_9CAUL|nr:hypothetical protein [Caulobacter segnis]PZR36637.1 MAG: hypothetical protein DI526_02735 [Caulobacter segnis]
MTFQDLLKTYLDTARQAVDRLDRDIDPRVRLHRIGWALAEIRAKTVATPAIALALAEVDQALEIVRVRLNSVALIIHGLASEKAVLLDRIDTLETALTGVEPDPVTLFLLGC